MKVLDFGLAKAFEPATVGGNATMSPTLSIDATQAGLILGSAAYMSPAEQARGRPVDRRADIWAYGAAVFEMMTGRAPFPGDDTSYVLARVIERDADRTLLPPATPSVVQRLLMRWLKKDSKDRLHAIGDGRIVAHTTEHSRQQGEGDPPGPSAHAVILMLPPAPCLWRSACSGLAHRYQP